MRRCRRSRSNRRGGLLLFIAERYLPGVREYVVRADVACTDAKRSRETSELLTEEGTDLGYLVSALVPADQICFALLLAHSAGRVQQLIARAAIHYEYIVEAVRLRECGNASHRPLTAPLRIRRRVDQLS